MKRRVLFLCTANSARSLMAEAVLRHQAGEHFEVFSAGVRPEQADARALDALAQSGIPVAGLHGKPLEALPPGPYDFVITLCDKARRECGEIGEAGAALHWDLADPRASADGEAFKHTLQALSERIRLFVLLKTRAPRPDAGLAPLELFRQLADETRLAVLMLVAVEGELCVCELVAALAQSQPKVSRHLALLREAGLLRDRRKGQWVYYSLPASLPDWARQVLELSLAASAGQVAMLQRRLAHMGERPSRCG